MVWRVTHVCVRGTAVHLGGGVDHLQREARVEVLVLLHLVDLALRDVRQPRLVLDDLAAQQRWLLKSR